MIYEEMINRAFDLLAESKNIEAQRQFQNCINAIKADIAAGEESWESHLFWGLCLSGMEEPEQALLRFERGLKFDNENEACLWQISSTLLYELKRPEEAFNLLEERLCRLYPDNSEYEEARKVAEMMSKPLDRERLFRNMEAHDKLHPVKKSGSEEEDVPVDDVNIQNKMNGAGQEEDSYDTEFQKEQEEDDQEEDLYSEQNELDENEEKDDFGEDSDFIEGDNFNRDNEK